MTPDHYAAVGEAFRKQAELRAARQAESAARLRASLSRSPNYMPRPPKPEPVRKETPAEADE